jgi:hypothetical protein
VQGQVQPGHHAEVGARAAQRPEQVRITGRLDDLAVGGDQFRAGEVVAGGPEPAGQPADPAAQGQPGQPGVADDAGCDGQAVLLGSRVELAVQHPGPGPGQSPRRVNLDLADGPQVDHQAAVADRPPGHAVPAGPDRDRQAVLAGEPDRGGHVRGVLAARDHRRAAVDRAVPDPAGRVVALVPVDKDLALTSFASRTSREASP